MSLEGNAAYKQEVKGSVESKGEVVGSVSLASGGYYLVSARNEGNTLVFSYTPSQNSMPKIEDQVIYLPNGGSGGGENGSDGMPITHRWEGTTLFVTSASGTSSANLKGDTGATGAVGPKGERGEKGDTGSAGAAGESGKDGFSPITTVTQTDTGAVISITDANGTTTATVTNGKDGRDGADGKDGADGYTPQKGVDYYTNTEKTEMVAAVMVSIPSALSASFAKSGSSITVTMPLDDGSTRTDVISLDTDGYPTSVTSDGKAIPISWEGFE